MSERDDQDKPETAVEELLHEAEEAARRTTGSPGSRRRRSGEGEAITPNTEAQEQSRGE